VPSGEENVGRKAADDHQGDTCEDTGDKEGEIARHDHGTLTG
jgi:hypothetical protein